jgi:hypothetical protein
MHAASREINMNFPTTQKADPYLIFNVLAYILNNTPKKSWRFFETVKKVYLLAHNLH